MSSFFYFLIVCAVLAIALPFMMIIGQLVIGLVFWIIWAVFTVITLPFQWLFKRDA